MACSLRTRALLAGVGGAALLAYTLACNTAFSPDDSQVLYPAFDPSSGAPAVAVYDRKTGRSETIFAEKQAEDKRDDGLMRAQWLPDGKHVLVACMRGDDELALHVLPRGIAEPVRNLETIKMKNVGQSILYPFCMLGTNLYLFGKEKLACVDLLTGRIATADNTNRLALLPGADGATIVGITEMMKIDKTDGSNTFTLGVLDPRSLVFRPTLVLSNALAEGTLPNYNPRTRQVIYVTGEETNRELRVVTDGRETFRRSLARGDAKQWFGLWLDIGPRTDRVVTAYVAQRSGTNGAEHGVVEIPLQKNETLRWVPLFTDLNEGKKSEPVAQGALSHDGRTWALATTLLNDAQIKPADRALFLVDLSKPQPEITKVPIAKPPDRHAGGGSQ